MSGKGDKKRRRALDAYGRLQRAAGLASARVEASVHPFGLSASQFGVLDTLATRGSVHQQELAEALGRSKAQMTAIIDALESRHLVRRERHPTDRRFITVHLTEAGTKVLAQAAPARTAAIVDLMSELTGEQRARLARLCRRLLRTLDPAETERETESDTDVDADDEHDNDHDDTDVRDVGSTSNSTSSLS
jgi:MarR family transcriptional regulator, 2-MHQ and catechol-resistance regulon repressor